MIGVEPAVCEVCAARLLRSVSITLPVIVACKNVVKAAVQR